MTVPRSPGKVKCSAATPKAQLRIDRLTVLFTADAAL
jgi:hypothetical protein